MSDKKALVVGGINGIGMSIAQQLVEREYEKIYIADRDEPACQINYPIEYVKFKLLLEDYSLYDNYFDIDTLILTAGFDRISPFDYLEEFEIINNFKANIVSAIRILKKFYNKLCENKNFYCAVMESMAGSISSPSFCAYEAAKISVCKFIESINIGLEMKDSPNRILNVLNIQPGSIKGAKPDNGINGINFTVDLAKEILLKMYAKGTIFIPDGENVYKSIFEGNYNNSYKFGIENYKYNEQNMRLKTTNEVKVGYLSGTFDLFHIGHLNILRRAKEYCDYLVVGVHKDGSHKKKEVFIPFDERVEIVKSIKYVDKVIESLPEDNDVYNLIKYNFLFVGSDYKGTEKFNRYEEYFKDTGVKIMYFPYTKGTSSTQLRVAIDKVCKE